MNKLISYRFLIENYKVPKGTIDCGINSNRKGKSTSWENYKDKIVYIKVDTIPSPTRKKYGILTTAEQEEQEVKKSEQLRAIYDDQIKKHIYKSKNIQHMRPCQRP